MFCLKQKQQQLTIDCLPNQIKMQHETPAYNNYNVFVFSFKCDNYGFRIMECCQGHFIVIQFVLKKKNVNILILVKWSYFSSLHAIFELKRIMSVSFNLNTNSRRWLYILYRALLFTNKNVPWKAQKMIYSKSQRSIKYCCMRPMSDKVYATKRSKYYILFQQHFVAATTAHTA